jgi:hypothetical protein
LIPCGWESELVRISATIPLVLLLLRWSSFRIISTVRPIRIEDLCPFLCGSMIMGLFIRYFFEFYSTYAAVLMRGKGKKIRWRAGVYHRSRYHLSMYLSWSPSHDVNRSSADWWPLYIHWSWFQKFSSCFSPQESK